MKPFFIAILILLTGIFTAGAEVLTGSLHAKEASIINDYLHNYGYNCDVMIANITGVIVYGVYVTDYSWEGITQNYEIFGAAVGAVGSISETAEWHSDYLMCFFDNISLTVTTANCRWFIANYENLTPSDFGTWLNENVVVEPNYVHPYN